jgi:acyl-CoA thioester hydrolase
VTGEAMDGPAAAGPDRAPPRPPRGRRGDYRRFTPIATRWMDNDAYGHVNNVVYYSYFDTAVATFLIGAGVLDIKASGVIGLVVETSCRYFAEIAFPDLVHVGLRVGHVGRSSVRYEIGIFANADEEAAAEGHFVHVYVDRLTRRPVPMPEPLRAALSAP